MTEINVLDCSADQLPNTGTRKFCFEDMKSIYKPILLPKDYEFATITDALTQSNWQDQIEALSDRFYPLAENYNIEDQSEAPATEDFPVRGSFQVNDGRLQAIFWMKAPKYWKNNINQFANKEWDFAFVDESGKILMSTPDGTKISGLTGNLQVGNDRLFQAGDVIGDLIPITVTLTDVPEWKENGVILQPLNESSPWNPKNLDGLIDLDLATVGSPTASLIVVSVTAKYSSELISGFGTATANWTYTGGSITSVVDNGDGTYNLVGSGLTSGNLNLAAASVLSLDGFESTGAIAVTI